MGLHIVVNVHRMQQRVSVAVYPTNLSVAGPPGYAGSV